MSDGEVKKGSVKWFNDQKGFGFITPDDGSEDLFVHQSSIKSDGFRSLGDGEVVEYTVEYGSDGRAKAANWSRVSHMVLHNEVSGVGKTLLGFTTVCSPDFSFFLRV
ncbi:hypothetical protein SASPL_128976 [Salvia splendens]|uniref:CSD domain-containing protein n=1 Tax=Salvia splendens TaxID=180675 RepID=A0A8X8XCJ0_SALSN|nr:hypothetical protein SASPL_128976 [Salvia splendens]